MTFSNSSSRSQTRSGQPTRTGTSTRTPEQTGFSRGRQPPNWLGPLTAIDLNSPEFYGQASSVSQSHSSNGVGEIHITTVVPLSRPSLMVWCLPVRGKTTLRTTSSTFRHLFRLEGSTLWVSPYCPEGRLYLHVSMEGSKTVLKDVRISSWTYNDSVYEVLQA